ncbi:MAG TPA: hypothetical protein VHU85_10120 [Acidimicrobiales bacterium]|jgi:hypothetical protein|nr:hypothetical protein [Acidimicrobiales bacterium]
MTPPESKTHRIAVLQQDNGELQEDVVERSVVEPATDDPPVSRDPGDENSGADPEDDDPEGEAPSGSVRVVHSLPVDDVEERDDPGSPVPGTLPRP